MSLYENIHKKRKRIAAGSGEKMRKKGDKGAPTEANFKRAAKTAKKPKDMMYGSTVKKKKNMMGGSMVHSGMKKRKNMRGGGYTSMNSRYANGGKIYPKVGM